MAQSNIFDLAARQAPPVNIFDRAASGETPRRDVSFGGAKAEIANRESAMARIVAAARKAGFGGKALETAAAIAMAESGGNPTAKNQKAPDDSHGLWQVNYFGKLMAERTRKFGPPESQYDPDTNARSAFRISGGGANFTPWTTYTSGAYKEYLGLAESAARGVRVAAPTGGEAQIAETMALRSKYGGAAGEAPPTGRQHETAAKEQMQSFRTHAAAMMDAQQKEAQAQQTEKDALSLWREGGVLPSEANPPGTPARALVPTSDMMGRELAAQGLRASPERYLGATAHALGGVQKAAGATVIGVPAALSPYSREAIGKMSPDELDNASREIGKWVSPGSLEEAAMWGVVGAAGNYLLPPALGAVGKAMKGAKEQIGSWLRSDHGGKFVAWLEKRGLEPDAAAAAGREAALWVKNKMRRPLEPIRTESAPPEPVAASASPPPTPPKEPQTVEPPVGATPQIAIPGQKVGTNAVKVPGGRQKFNVSREIVELDQPITSHSHSGVENPNYPGDKTQLRERSKPGYLKQIDDYARNPDFDALLDPDPTIDRGAPKVDERNIVLQGNGRMEVIRRMAEKYPKNYAEYVRRLTEMHPEAKMLKRPVLVERFGELTPEERLAIGQKGNVQTSAMMDAAEQAKMDAALLPEGLADRFERGGKSLEEALGMAKNKGLVKDFVARLDPARQTVAFDTEGLVSPAARGFMARAIMSDVLGDEATGVLTRAMVDEAGVGGRIYQGMEQAADSLLQLKKGIEGGEPLASEARSAINQALEYVDEARNSKLPVTKWFEQGSLESRDPIAMKMGKALVQAKSSKQVAEIIRQVNERAQAASGGMFGEEFGITSIGDLFNQAIGASEGVMDTGRWETLGKQIRQEAQGRIAGRKPEGGGMGSKQRGAVNIGPEDFRRAFADARDEVITAAGYIMEHGGHLASAVTHFASDHGLGAKAARAFVNEAHARLKGIGYSSVVDKVSELLKNAGRANKEQREINAGIRSRQAGRLGGVKGQGEAGLNRGLSILKGAFPKMELNPVGDLLDQGERDAMFNIIDAYQGLSPQAYVGLKDTLRKLLDFGTVPTKYSLDWYRKIFGERFVSSISEQRTRFDKIKDVLSDVVISVPRLVTATLDNSFGLNQGMKAFWTDNPAWRDAFVKSFQAMADEDVSNLINHQIRVSQYGALGHDHGLNLLEPGSTDIALAEELFTGGPVTGWLNEHVPGIKHADRAFTTWGNVLRSHKFEQGAKLLERNDAASDEMLDLWADYVNKWSGRGNLGKGRFKNAGNMLSEIFYSPKYNLSLIQHPITSAKMLFLPEAFGGAHNALRKQVARDMAQYLVGTLGTLAVGQKLGIWTVNLDPGSSDFLKAKVGNTRYDLTGGFAPMLSTMYILLAGARTTQAGRRKELSGEMFGRKGIQTPETRFSVAISFLRKKFSPAFGLGADMLDRKTITGDPVTVKGEALDRLVPFWIQDMSDAIGDELNAQGASGIPEGVAKGIPSFFGARESTYAPKRGADRRR